MNCNVNIWYARHLTWTSVERTVRSPPRRLNPQVAVKGRPWRVQNSSHGSRTEWGDNFRVMGANQPLAAEWKLNSMTEVPSGSFEPALHAPWGWDCHPAMSGTAPHWASSLPLRVTVPHFTVTARNVLASNKLNSADQPSFESRSSCLQVRTQRGRLRSLLRVLRKQTRINCALLSFHVSISF